MLPKQAGLSVDGEVVMTVSTADQTKVRSVKLVTSDSSMVVDKALPAAATLETDFTALAAELDASVPCIALVRLEPAAGDSSAPPAGSSDWAMITWAPDEAPVRQRMLCASSKKAVVQALPDVEFKEYQATEKSEVTFAAFVEATRERTEDDRRAAMTLQEQAEEDAKKEMLKEQAAAPMRMPGMIAMKVKADASFTDALKKMLSTEKSVVLAKMGGEKGEELMGELLEGISSVSALKGKLPSDHPCYILMLAGEALLVASWLPEDSPAKAKMKFSTFKGSVMNILKDSIGDKEVLQAECREEEDLVDDLAAKCKSGSAAGAAAPKPGGFKPPPGAMALPGMGMPLPGMRK
mmetsp:Transcript_23512/g.54808  ORF Transcript_23512/g.54808 Transcript_23512/m.54808 type:complete len:351 (+) Transcript_23512:85-1137(+)